MSISLIVPFYMVDSEKKKVLNRMLESVKGQYDELIIVWNEKMGFSKAVNMGYELSHSDFIIMACDDVILKKGTLKQLCDPEAVTSAQIDGMRYQDFWGTMWCTPRWIYEKTGPIDEEYSKGLYWDDNEYYEMISKVCKPYTNIHVVIEHPEGGRTLNKDPERQAKMDKNHEYFVKKWGKEPIITTLNTNIRYGLRILDP